MKRISVGSVAFPPDEREHWGRLVAQYCSKTKWFEALNERARPFVFCTFDTADPKYHEFLAVLDRHGLKWSERIEHVYTDEELRSFPLLEIDVLGREPISGANCEYGTEYDTSHACRTCGTGASQTSPLMIPLKGLPKKGLVCETAKGHLLVATSVADALREAGTSGLELRQALFYRNGEPLPWWQILPAYTLPRMTRSKNLIRDTEPMSDPTAPKWGCSVCQRDMFAFKGPEPADWLYDRQVVDPAALPDVVQSWECFGRSFLHDDPERHRVRGFAQPAILVKPRVVDLFRRLKVKHARFAPVRIMD